MEHISDAELDWLTENLDWIHRTCAEEWASMSHVPFDKEHFNHTLKADPPTPDHIRLDLCSILAIDQNRVDLSIYTDARDISGMPLVIEGLAVNSYLEVDENVEVPTYTIALAKAVVDRPRKVLKEFVLRFSEMVAHMSGSPLSGPDLQQVCELFSLYLGFASIWSSDQGNVTYSTDGMWERRSRSADPLPRPMLVAAIALLNHLRPGVVDLGRLESAMSREVQTARNVLLGRMSSKTRRDWELVSHMRAGDLMQMNHRYQEAVEAYERALVLANESADRALIHNNIGYALVCEGQYERSIGLFIQALELEPDFAYAMDNMGYAYVMLEQLEPALNCLRKAASMDGNHPGYTHRNMALWYLESGDIEAALEAFTRAFDCLGDVDLLEYHYARFLLSQGLFEEAVRYASISAERGEPHGIELYGQLVERQ